MIRRYVGSSGEPARNACVDINIIHFKRCWKYWVLLDQRACSCQNWTPQNKNSHWTSRERRKRDGMTQTSRNHYYYKINIKSHRSWKISQWKHCCKIWSNLTTTNQYSINALIKSNSWTLCYTWMSSNMAKLYRRLVTVLTYNVHHYQ